MSWQGDQRLSSSHSQTNVPDYQKMLQAPQYVDAGWMGQHRLEEAKTLMPSPVVQAPGAKQAYLPSKYGLVAATSATYPGGQYIVDGNNVLKPGERAVQYSTRDGERIYRIEEAYLPDPATGDPQYDQDYQGMKTQSSWRTPEHVDGYKTPPHKSASLSEFHELPKSSSAPREDMKHWQSQQRDQQQQQQKQYYDQDMYSKGERQVGLQDQGMYKGVRQVGLHDQDVYKGVRQVGLQDQGMYNKGVRQVGLQDQDMYNKGVRQVGLQDQDMYNKGARQVGLQDQDVYSKGVRQVGLQDQGMYKGVRQVELANQLQQLSVRGSDEAQWDPVRRAADSIIQEKNLVIHELKTKVSMLEEDLGHYENKLRNVIISKEDRDDVIHLKVQELQHKNNTLKTDLIDMKAQKNAEIDEMEIKLGATEHELLQVKAMMMNKESEIRELQTRLGNSSKEVDEWRSKFQEMKSSHQKMRSDLDSLERYLSDLPTVEEKSHMAKELLSLREERALNQGTIEELENRLLETKQTLSSRDMDVSEMEHRQQQLSDRLSDATDELDRLRSEGSGAALYKAEVELADTREEKERLAIDLEKAKKLLETTVRRLRHLEAKHQSEIRQLEESVGREGEAVDALRADVDVKDSQIEAFRRAMKDLGTTNQDVVEQNLILKEQLKNLELQCTDETMKYQRRFMRELGLCFSELQSLVQVCMQRAHGEQPNMSMLLGVKMTSVGDSDDSPTHSEEQTVMQWLKKVSELRSDVARLRSIISNKYAEEIGDNLECNQQ